MPSNLEIIKQLEQELGRKFKKTTELMTRSSRPRTEYVLDENKHVIGIMITGSGISKLPEGIGQLTNLRRIKLNNNQLTALPEGIGRLTNLQQLDLDDNLLTALPEWMMQLTNLQDLSLNANRLRALPEWIGQLTNLQQLCLSVNQLTALSEETGRLTNLQALYVFGNQLTALSEWIVRLTNLQKLDLGSNRLMALPEWIGRLINLQSLYLSSNQLTALPEGIGQLTNLQDLYLSGNQLTALPRSMARLENLELITLDGNPLNPALLSAYERGIDALREYLRSLEDTARVERLYEAKLVLVGEGAVGKTTLLKALTGRDPRTGEPTTHGVSIEIQAMAIPHPEKAETEIRLNAWDFGGQEVYRVTHQFFFSRRSIYLIVWEPRKGVQQCQVEDWLKLIRLRVGHDARVIIVSTHSKTGNRIARIDTEVLQRDFGEMIAGFLEVDSLVPDSATGEMTGVAALRKMIVEVALGLEHVGMEFNRDWREARDELLRMKEPHISYEEFATVCTRHGLGAEAARTLAGLMHDLGYIVYWGDDERLQNDVVLQPEWLTKAIGFVLEDRATQEQEGILPDSRLKEVWRDHPFKDETRYGPELYPFFLRLMEKYDVSYRLRDAEASLIAQHVPQVRPQLPWLPGDPPPADNRRIAMVCVMEEEPPGLVPWMIVRTHQYAYECGGPDGKKHRLHWQKGMFLCNGTHGEAMLELREREFQIAAQAVWPQYFMEKLGKILHKLITDNWPGLEGRYFFAVPCEGKRDSRGCKGRFDIDALHDFLERGIKEILCQHCRTQQNIETLLFGFEKVDAREQLARMEMKLDRGFAELESRLANYMMAILRAIANEAKDGPRLFTIEPVDGNWHRLTAKIYRLHLWCEAEGCSHPVNEKGKGIYEFDATREWIKEVAPYANFVAGVLRTMLPMVAPAVNVFFGDKTIEQLGIQNHLDLMKEATGKLLEGELEITDQPRLREGMLSEAERSGILALHAFLRQKDPNHARLGLRRVQTYTGDYLWLCEKHYQEMQPKIPERIE